MDDIESKFAEIKGRLSKCKELTRPDGVPLTPVGKGKRYKGQEEKVMEEVKEERGESKDEDESPQMAQKKEKKKTRSSSRRRPVKDEENQSEEGGKKVGGGRVKGPSSSLERALHYKLSKPSSPPSTEPSPVPTETTRRRRAPKASSMIQSLIKKGEV